MNSLKETSYSNRTKAKLEATYLDEKDSDKTAAQIKAAIRTVFVVSALSFHSTIDSKCYSVCTYSVYNLRMNMCMIFHFFEPTHSKICPKNQL